MTDEEQRKFEAYLREFVPQQPAALPASPVVSQAVPSHWRRYAAAAVLLVAGGASVWLALHRSLSGGAFGRPPAERPGAGGVVSTFAGSNNEASPEKNGGKQSVFALTRLALDKPEEFASVLSRQEARTLEQFQGSHSALRALAGE